MNATLSTDYKFSAFCTMAEKYNIPKKNKGFSKKRNTSEISYMTNISYKATNRSNTLCIARFGNAVNDVCHRKFAVREVFRGSLMLSRLPKPE